MEDGSQKILWGLSKEWRVAGAGDFIMNKILEIYQ
jgi:hypothetical protein